MAHWNSSLVERDAALLNDVLAGRSAADQRLEEDEQPCREGKLPPMTRIRATRPTDAL